MWWEGGIDELHPLLKERNVEDSVNRTTDRVLPTSRL